MKMSDNKSYVNKECNCKALFSEWLCKYGEYFCDEVHDRLVEFLNNHIDCGNSEEDDEMR